MKKIAIDIDDTITDTSEQLFIYLNNYEKVDLSDPINNKIDIMRGKITCPELLDFYKEYAEQIAASVKPKEGVKEAFDYLRETGVEIYILSSRIPETLAATLNFFKRYELSYTFLEVNVYDKVSYCKENKIDYLIDDSIETCQKINEFGIKPILFTSSINKKHELDGISRLDSWLEIDKLKILLDIN